jgi:hypothetical protein
MPRLLNLTKKALKTSEIEVSVESDEESFEDLRD